MPLIALVDMKYSLEKKTIIRTTTPQNGIGRPDYNNQQAIEKYLEKRLMKSRQLVVLMGFLLLEGCSAFFQEVPGLGEVKKVAIASILLNPAENAPPKSDTMTQIHSSRNPLHFNSQALLEFAYTQLQNQIETQLHWKADTDVRHKPLREIDNEGYEYLHGASLIPASAIYALSSGSSPASATQDYIKELCRQLDVDAIVMMGINTDPRKKGLLSKFKKERGTPSVLLNLSVVDKQGRVILNTEHFDEVFSGRTLSNGTPTSAQVLDDYKVSTSKALEDYFYRSSMIIKRMGYQQSKIQDMTLGDRAKQPIEPGSASIDSHTSQAEKPPTKSTMPLRATRSTTLHSEAKTINTQNTTKAIDDSEKNEQETSGSKPTRRSIWSFPEEPTK